MRTLAASGRWRPGHELYEVAKLGDEIVQHGPGLRSLIEIDGERELDLAAVAGRGEIGRSEDDPGRPLPQEHGDLGVEQAAGDADGSTSHRRFRFSAGLLRSTSTETCASLSRSSSSKTATMEEICVALSVHGRQAEETRQAVLGEKVGLEGERRSQASHGRSRTLGRRPVIEEPCRSRTRVLEEAAQRGDPNRVHEPGPSSGCSASHTGHGPPSRAGTARTRGACRWAALGPEPARGDPVASRTARSRSTGWRTRRDALRCRRRSRWPPSSRLPFDTPGQLAGTADNHLVGSTCGRSEAGPPWSVRPSTGCGKRHRQGGETLVSDDCVDDAAESGRARRPQGVQELGLSEIAIDGGRWIASSARVSCGPVVTRDRRPRRSLGDAWSGRSEAASWPNSQPPGLVVQRPSCGRLARRHEGASAIERRRFRGLHR